jgi:hypothetical protein
LSSTIPYKAAIQGNSTSYAISITKLYGFNGNVSLKVAGLPAGTSGTFSSTTTKVGSSLSLKSTTKTPVGIYKVTVIGTSGSIVRTLELTLEVVARPSFTLNAAPSLALSASAAGKTVTRGGQATFNVKILPVGNFNSNVTLSASKIPGKSTAVFLPKVTANSSVLTISTASTTPKGTYNIVITGTGGGVTTTTTISLIVN